MLSRTLRFRRALIAGWLLGLGALVGLLVVAAGGQEESGSQPIAREDVQACMMCHKAEQAGRQPVNQLALQTSAHRDKVCQDCHFTITAYPHTPEMMKEKAACSMCHTEQQEAYLKSTHAKRDKQTGDHPACVTCHGDGDPHAAKSLRVGTSAEMAQKRMRNVLICSHCHADKARMGRYRVDPDAVPSYNESFHGKALLRFKNTKVAICTDCHRHHDVLNPNDPHSPTNRNNAAKTCGQAGCHSGAQVNFAMSGANHLRLKLKHSPVLFYELWFFRLLIMGVISGMLAVIMLDLRRELFNKTPPPSGRLVAFLITVGFLFIITTIALATLEMKGALYTWLTAMALLALAFLLYFLRPRSRRETHAEKPIPRLSRIMRIQHLLLALCFTTLAVTGLPLRFADAAGVPRIHMLFGGFAGARHTHRIAAVILIATWVWHLGWLLLRWRRTGFSLKALTMLPNRKDLTDFLAAARYYLGLSHEEPKYGRFQFREKMDYLAEYWGMPVMILSGFVLWFPIYWGNRLPEIGISFAYIAHSYEATLAFLAIVTWHLYNAHFNPSTFPMNPVWMTGVMSREEMEREHPLELERIEGKVPTDPDYTPEVGGKVPDSAEPGPSETAGQDTP